MLVQFMHKTFIEKAIGKSQLKSVPDNPSMVNFIQQIQYMNLTIEGTMKSSLTFAGKTVIIIFFLFFNLFFAKNNLNAAPNEFSEISVFDSTLVAQLQHALDAQLTKQKITGISAAVLLPNDSIWLGASGMSDPVNGDTMSTDMLFRTGSVGKNLTATVVLQLMEDGKLNLNDSLYQWLPALHYIDSTITIKQLLNHTSGVYHFLEDPSLIPLVFSDPDKYWTQEEVISTFVHEPYFLPGDDFYYSSTDYVLLSMIIEEATGSYFPVAMENQLGDIDILDHTYFAWSDTIKGDFVHPWFDFDGNGTLDDAFDKYRSAVASVSFGTGGVISTAEDMARWMKYLFEENILTQKTMEQMLEFETGWYGLGVMKYSEFNTEFWGHTGWSPGYQTIVYYSPADSICIAVLSNDDKANRTNIFKALLEVIYAIDHPQITFENSTLDLGEFSTSASKYDTTFFVFNTGGETDSVLAYVTYTGISDSNALSLEPSLFDLAPGDSQAITFTIIPSLLTPKQYTTWLFLDSKFSPITPRVSKAIKYNITGTSLDNVIKDIPANFVLNQNYPNPFNPSTIIQYSLPQSKKVILKIFNLQRQEIETLINERKNAGVYSILWYPMNIPGGIYIVHLVAGDFVDSKKLIFLK